MAPELPAAPRPVRVLHLDDSALDAELIRERILADDRVAWEFTHVLTGAEFERVLAAGRFDLILTDYNIPGYDGLVAVERAHGLQPDVPIIVISGAVSEEDAVLALRAGATDYIFKQRLQRLAPAARRALEEAAERRRRRLAEAAVRNLSERLGELARNSSDVVWVLGLDPERLFFVSPSVERIWGQPAQAFYDDPRAWLKAVHEDDRARVARSFEASIAGESERFDALYRVVRPDGAVRWIHDSGTLLHDAQGRVDHLSGIARDVTERVEAERQIRESEARFRATFEQAAVGITFHDFNGRRVRMNQRYCEILGYTAEELAGDLIIPHPGDRSGAREDFEALESDPDLTRATKRHVRKDGSVVWCDVTRSVVRDADGNPTDLVTIMQDVTERVHAQQRLAETEALLRSAVTSMAEGFVLQDLELRIVQANPSAERILGFKMRDLTVPAPASSFFITVREDGSPLDPAEWPSARVRRTGRAETDVVLGVKRRDGELVWISVNSTPLRLSEEADPIGVLSTLRDITQTRRAEEEIRRLNASLERKVQERTRELESFSYSVSHDLRAPLHAVSGFAEALSEDCAARLDERGRHYLDRIRSGATRMDALIEDLLALSKLSRVDLLSGPVDMTALVASVAQELREQHPAQRVRVEVAPAMRAHGDERLLRIALTNLMGNAWKFSSQREDARIEVGQRPGDGPFDIFFVRDNGAGFDPAHADRLFGAFQRLHSQSEFPGTGIGLATVRRVIERHGGRVWATGAVGEGATFLFSLPEAGARR